MKTLATRTAKATEEIGAQIAQIQGATTEEISRSFQEAARGTGQVTGSIESVKYGAGETGAAATEVLSAAQELTRHAENLGREVEVFLADVKAA